MVDKKRAWYRTIDRVFENHVVFNLNQILLDGGKTRQIRRFLAGVPFSSVIDIGCGTGNWAAITEGPYVGIDTSESFIASCRKRYEGDPGKQFFLGDAVTFQPEEPVDLAVLISVLHHLPDEEALRLFDWVGVFARYFFVLDLYPVRWNPLSRWLYAMDRGDHVRKPDQQKNLILSSGRFDLVKEDSYRCPNGLYRHTLFLFEQRSRYRKPGAG